MCAITRLQNFVSEKIVQLEYSLPISALTKFVYFVGLFIAFKLLIHHFQFVEGCNPFFFCVLPISQNIPFHRPIIIVIHILIPLN